MRRCDDTIAFSPTIRILKTTIIGPFEGRFIPEDKHSITPRNGFLVKVLSMPIIAFHLDQCPLDISGKREPSRSGCCRRTQEQLVLSHTSRTKFARDQLFTLSTQIETICQSGANYSRHRIVEHVRRMRWRSLEQQCECLLCLDGTQVTMPKQSVCLKHRMAVL